MDTSIYLRSHARILEQLYLIPQHKGTYSSVPALKKIKKIKQQMKDPRCRNPFREHTFGKFQNVRPIHILVHVFSDRIVAFDHISTVDIITGSILKKLISAVSKGTQCQRTLASAFFLNTGSCTDFSVFFRKQQDHPAIV
jgi:hypothetical protein